MITDAIPLRKMQAGFGQVVAAAAVVLLIDCFYMISSNMASIMGGKAINLRPGHTS